eukprot:gene22894-biopygen8808
MPVANKSVKYEFQSRARHSTQTDGLTHMNKTLEKGGRARTRDANFLRGSPLGRLVLSVRTPLRALSKRRKRRRNAPALRFPTTCPGPGGHWPGPTFLTPPAPGRHEGGDRGKARPPSPLPVSYQRTSSPESALVTNRPARVLRLHMDGDPYGHLQPNGVDISGHNACGWHGDPVTTTRAPSAHGARATWHYTVSLTIVPAAGCAEQARVPERARHVADVGLLGSPIILPPQRRHGRVRPPMRITAGFAHQPDGRARWKCGLPVPPSNCTARQGSPTNCALRQGSPTSLMGGRGGSGDWLLSATFAFLGHEWVSGDR